MVARMTRRLAGFALLVLAVPGALYAHGPGDAGFFAHLHPHGLEILMGVLAVGLGASLLLSRRRC